MIAWKGANKVDQTWMSLITDVGFPVAVTFYLLHRIETKLNTLNNGEPQLTPIVSCGH